MFSTISSAFKIAANLANIRTVISTVYTVVVKTAAVLAFLSTQTNNTKFGEMIGQYMPLITSVITKIKELIEKYGPIIGVDTSVAVVQQDVDHEKALKDAIASLDELLNK
jgi:hypothetical protein